MEASDIHDIMELNNLGKVLLEKQAEIADVANRLNTAQMEVMTLKMRLGLLKDSKSDHEELIRIKKLTTNLKPR